MPPRFLLTRWMVESVIRRSSSPGDELAGVQPAGVLEEPAEGGGVVALLVGLHGAAQRPQVFQHPFGVASLAAVGGLVDAAPGSGRPVRPGASPW